MNTLGVILSAACLLTALVELRIRSDINGRRMGAILAAAAWVTMGLVAWDQSRQCRMLLRRTATIPAREAVAEALRDQWQYKGPDGGVVTFTPAVQPEARLVGGQSSWHASQNDRL